ncbi:MAG: radical SAM protein [Cyanobacteriota bacterium]|jgi:uncharacterized protein
MVASIKARAHLDFDRLHSLDREDKVLVIDRVNGRWVMLPISVKCLLPLLCAPANSISDQRLEARVEELARLLAERGIGIAPPLEHKSLNTVILKLTKVCNLACSYCYDFEPDDRILHQQTKIILDVIRQAIDMSTGVTNFILHGGEPMLVWNMIEQLVTFGESYGQEEGVDVRFIGQTNLTQLDQRKVNFSMLHGIRWGVSLDGNGNLNDKFRVFHNGAGSYEAIRQKIAMFPEFIQRSNALSTITASNQSHLLEIACHMQSLGFAGWDWTLFQPIGRGRQETHFEYDVDALIHAWDELFDAILQGQFIGFAVEPILKYLNNFIDGPVANMCMRSQCGASRDLLSVSFDGTIEACDCIDPCGDLAHLGHMENGGLTVAYSSEKADFIRSRNVEMLQCGSCLWQAVCGGTCLARAGGIYEICQNECKLSLHAFDRISSSIAASDSLLRYKLSCS